MFIGDIDYLFMITIGITLVCLGGVTVVKIYRGSKIPFAYTMTAFTCAYGVTFVAFGVFYFFNNKRTVYV